MSVIISNLFSHIKNGQKTKALVITYKKTKKIENILKVLYENGYIRGIRKEKEIVEILLKYKNKKGVINKIQVISKPSQKKYWKVKEMHQESAAKASQDKETVEMKGIYILSTSKGIMSEKLAYKLNIGGEILGYIK